MDKILEFFLSALIKVTLFLLSLLSFRVAHCFQYWGKWLVICVIKIPRSWKETIIMLNCYCFNSYMLFNPNKQIHATNFCINLRLLIFLFCFCLVCFFIEGRSCLLLSILRKMPCHLCDKNTSIMEKTIIIPNFLLLQFYMRFNPNKKLHAINFCMI